MSAGKRTVVRPQPPASHDGPDFPPPVAPPPGEDDLNAARGIMNGVLYSIPIWFLLGMVGYLLWKVAQ